MLHLLRAHIMEARLMHPDSFDIFNVIGILEERMRLVNNDQFDLEVDSDHDERVYDKLVEIHTTGAFETTDFDITLVADEQTNNGLVAEQFELLSDANVAIERADKGQLILDVCHDSVTSRPSTAISSGKRGVVSTHSNASSTDARDTLHDYELLSLRDGEYVQDEVINHIFEKILNSITNAVDCHCLRTDLLQLSMRGVRHSDLIDMGRFVDEGLYSIFHTRKLILPIHLATPEHWILVNVKMELRVIELRNSLGFRPHNVNFFKNVLKFLYKEHILQDGALMSFESFAGRWHCLDMSNTCSNQENGYDCGIFTILNAIHLAQDITPTKVTFTQEQLNRLRIRQQLAGMIMSMGDEHEDFAEIQTKYQKKAKKASDAALRRARIQEKRKEKELQERRVILEEFEERKRMIEQQGQRRRVQFEELQRSLPDHQRIIQVEDLQQPDVVTPDLADDMDFEYTSDKRAYTQLLSFCVLLLHCVVVLTLYFLFFCLQTRVLIA